MSEVNITIGTLSTMRKDLSERALESLKGQSTKYAKRLGDVAIKTTNRSDLLDGTTINRPSILAYTGRRRIVRKIMPDFVMNIRSMPTPEGILTSFPLHILGITREGTPIIDPAIRDSYSVVHIPSESDSDRYNPVGMLTDLAFTVDTDNLVTVNGQNTVTIQEYNLFDKIVTEFESRSEIK